MPGFTAFSPVQHTPFGMQRTVERDPALVLAPDAMERQRLARRRRFTHLYNTVSPNIALQGEARQQMPRLTPWNDDPPPPYPGKQRRLTKLERDMEKYGGVVRPGPIGEDRDSQPSTADPSAAVTPQVHSVCGYLVSVAIFKLDSIEASLTYVACWSARVGAFRSCLALAVASSALGGSIPPVTYSLHTSVSANMLTHCCCAAGQWPAGRWRQQPRRRGEPGHALRQESARRGRKDPLFHAR